MFSPPPAPCPWGGAGPPPVSAAAGLRRLLPRGEALGAAMGQALRSGAWGAAGLSPRWWWRGARYGSTRERRPPPLAAPAAGGDEEGAPPGGGRQRPPPALPGVFGAAGEPRTPLGGLAPQSQPRPWHQRGAGQAAPAGAGPWGSPGGDFKARRRPGRKPLPIERTKGSEILFGIAPCSLALSQSRRDLFRLFLKQSSGPRRLVTSEFVLQATARGVPVHHVRRRELDALCRGQVHQGVCLEATPLRFKSLEDAEKPDVGDEKRPNRQLIWLVLEQIQDPMNLGAVLRSAYFLGVDRVVTSQRNRYGDGYLLLQLLSFFSCWLPQRFLACVARQPL